MIQIYVKPNGGGSGGGGTTVVIIDPETGQPVVQVPNGCPMPVKGDKGDKGEPGDPIPGTPGLDGNGIESVTFSGTNLVLHMTDGTTNTVDISTLIDGRAFVSVTLEGPALVFTNVAGDNFTVDIGVIIDTYFESHSIKAQQDDTYAVFSQDALTVKLPFDDDLRPLKRVSQYGCATISFAVQDKDGNDVAGGGLTWDTATTTKATFLPLLDNLFRAATPYVVVCTATLITDATHGYFRVTGGYTPA